MPDGGDHLRLQGHADVLDPRYTAPSSDAITRQVKYIEALVERVSDGLVIHAADFDNLDKLKAGAVLPDGALDTDEDMFEPLVTSSTVGHWRAERPLSGDPEAHRPSPAP